MRFTNLFTLLVASSALAYKIPTKRQTDEELNQALNDILTEANQDVTTDTSNTNILDESVTGMLEDLNSPECKKVLTEMEKCFMTNENNVEKICEKFNSNECKEALKNDFNALKALEVIMVCLLLLLKYIVVKMKVVISVQLQKPVNPLLLKI